MLKRRGDCAAAEQRRRASERSCTTAVSRVVIGIALAGCPSSTANSQTTGFDKQGVVATTSAARGNGGTANALTWGFNADDATEAIQGAITSGARSVVIPYVGRPWVVRPIRLASDQEIILEPGVVVLAKRGEFRGKHDALFNAHEVTNVTVRGYGATLRMWRDDYRTPPYVKAEWRHCLDLRGCTNVRVLGLTLESSGGDGIEIGPTWDARRVPCRNVTVADCICDGNYRQGISVVSADGLRIERCVFRNTSGTSPQAGIDVEPSHWRDPMVDIVVRDCISEGNVGSGLVVQLSRQTSQSRDVSILFDRCLVRDCKAPGFRAHVKEDAPKGLIEFRDCTCERTKYQGLYATWSTRSGIKLLFNNCKWGSVARWRTKVPILLELARVPAVSKLGGIDFVDCYVYDDRKRPFMEITAVAGGEGVFDVEGEINIIAPWTAGDVAPTAYGSIPLKVNYMPERR